SQHM
ncbi:Bgt-50060, partial [Blumeria graminis f. sp. tritici]